ncbi:histidine kinase [Cylindrospermum sp. NIES-4074]|nr:histidine kinase [Cylindrospermum sp. NIES-4074]
MIRIRPGKLRGFFKIWQNIPRQQMQKHNWTTPLILISTTLAIGIIGITSYKVVRGLILQQLQEKALLQVRQGTDEIDQWLAIRASAIQTMSNTTTVRSLNWPVISKYLQAEVKQTDEFFLFGMLSPKGYFYTSGRSNTNTRNNDREHIQKAKAGKLNISDPFIGRVTRIASIGIASPIRQNYDAAGAPIGVLFGNLKVNRLTGVVNKLSYGKGSYAFALNSQGQAIIHPNPALLSTAEKPAPSFLESTDPSLVAIARHMVNKKQGGIELIPIDGTEKYIAHVPLKQANWSIALVIPRENIESQLGALNILASILGGLLLLRAIVASRQIQLSEQAKKQVVMLSEQQKTLQEQAQALEQTLRELQQTQAQLIQTEKMSSLGQLVAGLAHEINNPISFIYSNIVPAHQYTQDLLRLLQLYQQNYPDPAPEIKAEAEAIEVDFLADDLPKLLTSMQVGAERIKQIVLSLRNFSRLDEADMKAVNIHEGIDSTLMILESRLKDTTNHPPITIIKEYDDLPPVECYAGQLNQVFMHVLTNAIDALEELFLSGKTTENPQISIRTQLMSDEQVIIGIADNGIGIPESIQKQVFDPFFTTKTVGKATGLGLSISYQIITEKHRGKLGCVSNPGQGTEFVIAIPINQTTLQIV